MKAPFRFDLAGRRFRRLTVVAYVGKNVHGKSLWECICDCGVIVRPTTGDLQSGNTGSCGCGQITAFRSRVERRKAEAVGSLHPRAQSSWRHMLERCNNPDSQDFKWYGARGISVCDRWHDLSAFIEDMGDPPPGTTLDRKDVDGNYEPSNCRWATSKEQSRNRRNNVYVEHEGARWTVVDLAQAKGIPATTIYSRVARGVSPL